MDTKHNPKPLEDLVYTAFRLPRDHRERLEALAVAQHRTLSGELRKLIDDHLRAHDLNGAS